MWSIVALWRWWMLYSWPYMVRHDFIACLDCSYIWDSSRAVHKSFISLLFLWHTVFFVHTDTHLHTYKHKCMLTCTLYSRSRMQNEHFVDLTFLICNYFPRIDFQKWYCYVKYVFFIALYIIMLISKQCYSNYLPLKKI